MKRLAIFIALVFSINLYAQSYTGGLPLPGLPKSVGPKTMSSSTSVTFATDQTPIGVTGTFTSTAANVGTNYAVAPTQSGEIGYIDGNGNLHPFLGDANGITVTALQGNAPWSVSRNWVLRGTVDSVGVTGTVSSSVTGTVSALQSGVWNLNSITGTVSLPTGAASEVNLNAVGQTITSMSAKLPATLGQKTRSASMSVTIASDQAVPVTITGTVSTLPVTVTASTITRSSNSASNQTLLALNLNRKQVVLYNDSTTNCYIKYGATASATSFTFKMFSTDTFTMDYPTYTGIIDYICDAATGNMEVNEQ